MNLNQQAFGRALTMANMYELLLGACRHLKDKRYEDEVVELHVDPTWTDDSLIPITDTWLRAEPVFEQDWNHCAVLRLDITPGDNRSVGPDTPPEEVPGKRSLLSLDRFSDAIHQFMHCTLTSDHIVLLVPVKGEVGHAPAVLQDAYRSENGWGSRLYLDAILITDHARLMRHFGPPFYGW